MPKTSKGEKERRELANNNAASSTTTGTQSDLINQTISRTGALVGAVFDIGLMVSDVDARTMRRFVCAILDEDETVPAWTDAEIDERGSKIWWTSTLYGARNTVMADRQIPRSIRTVRAGQRLYVGSRSLYGSAAAACTDAVKLHLWMTKPGANNGW